MTKKYLKIGVLLIVLLITSCYYKVSYNNGLKDYSSEYSKAKEMYSYFPDSLISHFPEDVDSSFSILYLYLDSNIKYNAYNSNKIFTIIYLDITLIEQLKEKFKDSVLSIIESNDPQTLIVNRGIRDMEYKDYIEKSHASIEERKERLELLNNIEKYEYNKIKRDSQQSMYPICNFSFAKLYGYHVSDSNRLTKDYTLYLIDAQKGDFYESNDSLLYDYGLPKDWQHGFSRGIAINEKDNIVLYWLEIW